MKIVVAVDSFKGSLTSNEAGKAIEEGIRRVFPDSNIVIKSMSDGGEGLIETLVNQMNGKIRTIKALDPLGKVIECSYGLIASRKLAVIEMAKVAGLTLVEPKDRNPLNTTTYGLGQMILDAIDQGYYRFIIGIGGSATNDGGIGMLQALGYKMLDINNKPVEFGAKGLSQLKIIDDGQGFDVSTAKQKGNYGLRNMEERVKSLGGILNLISSIGKGTSIDIQIPISKREVNV